MVEIVVKPKVLQGSDPQIDYSEELHIEYNTRSTLIEFITKREDEISGKWHGAGGDVASDLLLTFYDLDGNPIENAKFSGAILEFERGEITPRIHNAKAMLADYANKSTVELGSMADNLGILLDTRAENFDIVRWRKCQYWTADEAALISLTLREALFTKSTQGKKPYHGRRCPKWKLLTILANFGVTL